MYLRMCFYLSSIYFYYLRVTGQGVGKKWANCRACVCVLILLLHIWKEEQFVELRVTSIVYIAFLTLLFQLVLKVRSIKTPLEWNWPPFWHSSTSYRIFSEWQWVFLPFFVASFVPIKKQNKKVEIDKDWKGRSSDGGQSLFCSWDYLTM